MINSVERRRGIDRFSTNQEVISGQFKSKLIKTEAMQDGNAVTDVSGHYVDYVNIVYFINSFNYFERKYINSQMF